MADRQISELVEATAIEDNDLLVLQQGETAKKAKGKTVKDWVYNESVENFVIVSDTEPTTERNHIWVDPSEEDVVIPTMDDLQGLTAEDISYDGSATHTSGSVGEAISELSSDIDGLDAGDVEYDSSTTYGSGSVGAALATQSEKINEYNSYNVFVGNITNNTTSNYNAGIKWTGYENCTIKSESAVTGYPRFNLVNSTSSVPAFITKGKKYYIKYKSNDSDVKLEIYQYVNGTQKPAITYTKDGEITFDNNLTGLLIRLWCNSNSKTYNASVYVAMLQAPSNEDIGINLGNIKRLKPTGDTTDRTSEIQASLTEYGVCVLDRGVFYTTGITLGWGQEIIGVGRNTEIRLLDNVSNGAVITMDSQSTVKDLSIRGDTGNITPSATVGNRHGILIQGNADGSGNSIPVKMCIENLFINRFAGGAITCTNTGSSKGCYLTATNIQIAQCDAGINIAYFSEFNHFTNVVAEACYYGCINNGGNNMFANCDFSRNTLGFLMDNSNSQSPNNSHGSAVGCVFNHSNSNNGVGIKILNCGYGYTFTACQIFYSQIDVEDSSGIVFADSLFGGSNDIITIDDGGTVLFVNNIFASAPTITITDNDYVHFVNCYLRDTGEEVTP